MQQVDNSSSDVSTIAYVINIVFQFDPKILNMFYYKCEHIYETP